MQPFDDAASHSPLPSAPFLHVLHRIELQLCLQYLDASSLFVVSRTCRQLRLEAQDPFVWKSVAPVRLRCRRREKTITEVAVLRRVALSMTLDARANSQRRWLPRFLQSHALPHQLGKMATFNNITEICIGNIDGKDVHLVAAMLQFFSHPAVRANLRCVRLMAQRTVRGSPQSLLPEEVYPVVCTLPHLSTLHFRCVGVGLPAVIACVGRASHLRQLQLDENPESFTGGRAFVDVVERPNVPLLPPMHSLEQLTLHGVRSFGSMHMLEQLHALRDLRFDHCMLDVPSNLFLPLATLTRLTHLHAAFNSFMRLEVFGRTLMDAPTLRQGCPSLECLFLHVPGWQAFKIATTRYHKEVAALERPYQVIFTEEEGVPWLDAKTCGAGQDGAKTTTHMPPHISDIDGPQATTLDHAGHAIFPPTPKQFYSPSSSYLSTRV